MSPFLMQKLIGKVTSDKLSKWMKRYKMPNVFTRDRLYIPYNFCSHWVMIVLILNTTPRKVLVFDSLGKGSGGTALHSCKSKIETLLILQSTAPEAPKEVDLSFNNKNKWLFLSTDDLISMGWNIPQQEHSVDCAIFGLTAADYHSQHHAAYVAVWFVLIFQKENFPTTPWSGFPPSASGPC